MRCSVQNVIKPDKDRTKYPDSTQQIESLALIYQVEQRNASRTFNLQCINCPEGATFSGRGLGKSVVPYSLVFCHKKQENLFVALYDKSFLTHTKPPRTQRDGHFFGGLKKKPFVRFVSLCDKFLVAAIRVSSS